MGLDGVKFQLYAIENGDRAGMALPLRLTALQFSLLSHKLTNVPFKLLAVSFSLSLQNVCMHLKRTKNKSFRNTFSFPSWSDLTSCLYLILLFSNGSVVVIYWRDGWGYWMHESGIYMIIYIYIICWVMIRSC